MTHWTERELANLPTIECEVSGCPMRLPPSGFMCFWHYLLVPQDLWNAMLEAKGERKQELRAEIVQRVQSAENDSRSKR